MDIIFLELKLTEDQLAELHYRLPGQVQYESRNLRLVEIAGLYDFANRDFTKNNPNLAKIGQQLFNWLDGSERWLSRSISQKRGGLALAIDSQGKLGGLPWEILFYEVFLVARSIVPLRIVASRQQGSRESLRPIIYGHCLWLLTQSMCSPS
jgi:hypothetical protein